MKSKFEFIKGFIKENPIYLLFIVFILFSIIFVDGFSRGENLVNILVQSADLIIIACGLTFVIMNGGIDFSVVATINLGSVIGASIMSRDNGWIVNESFNWIIAIMGMLVVGLIIGAVNGWAVVKLKMPSFIATMATQLVFSGLALYFTQSMTIGNLPNVFNDIAQGSIAYIPIPLLLTFICGGIAYYLLHHTLFGRRVFAIGTNHMTSFISGIPVKRTIFVLFLLSGLFAATGGIIMTSRVGAGMPALAREMLLDIVAAVIIGGTSISGGKGSIIGTVLGGLFIVVINNSLKLLGVEWYVINVFKGVLIISVAFLDILRRRNR